MLASLLARLFVSLLDARFGGLIVETCLGVCTILFCKHVGILRQSFLLTQSGSVQDSQSFVALLFALGNVHGMSASTIRVE